jgi:hypothetical protein
MEVQRRAILQIRSRTVGADTSAHVRRVDRDEQVAACTSGQTVREFHSYGPVLLGEDHRTEILVNGRHRAAGASRRHLHVTANRGCGQIRVHRPRCLHERDFVIVGAWERKNVRRRDRRFQIWHQVDKLADPPISGPAAAIFARTTAPVPVVSVMITSGAM